MGFVAAARAVWTVCRDPANPRRQLFVPLKSNLAAEAGILPYSIQGHPEFDAPVIQWHHDSISLSVEEALRPKPRGPQADERNTAAAWLNALLASAPRSADNIFEEGRQRGFEVRTLRRALHAIGGQTQKRGRLDAWWWSLPQTPKDKPEVDVGKPVPFVETCPLPGNNDPLASSRYD
jgi:hypothetical protein